MSRKRPAAKKTLRREFLLRREKTNSVVGRGQEHSALVEKAATTRHREQTRRRELFLRGKTNWVTKSALRRPRRKGCDHESPKARSKSTLQPKDGAGRAVPGSLRLVERGLLGSPRRRNEPVHSSAGSAAAAWQNHGACRRQMARRLGVFGRRPPAFQPERPGSASGPEADGAPARPSPSVCAIRRPGDWVAARRDDCADSDWRTQFGQRGRADQQERAGAANLKSAAEFFGPRPGPGPDGRPGPRPCTAETMARQRARPGPDDSDGFAGPATHWHTMACTKQRVRWPTRTTGLGTIVHCQPPPSP